MDWSKREEIRDAYKNWTPRSDPYMYADWLQLFSAAEVRVWQEIRLLGLPFYPEYPVGKYFVDFADPVKKIAIEVDGALWHQDKESDAERQKAIEALGWRVVRIPGSAVFWRNEDDGSDENPLYESEGFLRELKLSDYTVEPQEE